MSPAPTFGLPPWPQNSQHEASQVADIEPSKPLVNGFNHVDPRERAKDVALRLLKLASKCRGQGMSGRSLRRLPVLAHARYIGTLPLVRAHISSKQSPGGTEVETWLDAMERVVQTQAMEKGRLEA